MLTLNERAELTYAQLGIHKGSLVAYVKVLEAFRTDLLAELGKGFEDYWKVAHLKYLNGPRKPIACDAYSAGAASKEAQLMTLRHLAEKYREFEGTHDGVYWIERLVQVAEGGKP